MSVRFETRFHSFVAALNEGGLGYALVGDLAMNLYGVAKRCTDLTLLIREDVFQHWRNVAHDVGLIQLPNRTRRFTDRDKRLQVNLVFPGYHPGSAYRGPICYHEPLAGSKWIAGYRVVGLQTLIELKLAARRFQDLADVSQLIRVHSLHEDYCQQLHPSVRADYLRCLAENEREDLFQALP